MQSSLAMPALATSLRFQISAMSILRADAATIESWRRQPLVIDAEKLPISVLRHAEEQSLLSLKAVLAARTQPACDGVSFTDWGVIAAPNFFGRKIIAQTIQRFQQEGAWGVSPHLIPHQSLHAASGTISQALQIHGPNFGVGGGPNSAADAFLLAAAMMMDGALPGLWLVLSGHQEEWIPAQNGPHPVAPDCVALALAMTPATSTGHGLHVVIGASAACDGLALLPFLEVGLLADDLSATHGLPAGKWRIGESHWIEFEATMERPEGRS